ncbi:Antagonist of MEN (Mitotic Exit Network), partial [Modicella reniformis]
MSSTDTPMAPTIDTQDSIGVVASKTADSKTPASSYHVVAPTPGTSQGHRRSFMLSRSTASSSFSSSSPSSPASSSREQSLKRQQNHRLPTYLTRAHSAASSFKRFFKAIVGSGGGIHPSDNAAFDRPTYLVDPNESERQTDEGASCGEREWNCGEHVVNSGTTTFHNSAMKKSLSSKFHKKRSDSTATTSSITNKDTKAGRASSVGGKGNSVQSNCTGKSIEYPSSIHSTSQRRSSVTSSIAGESIHNDLVPSSRKNSNNTTRIFMHGNQQYRHHFTGHEVKPTTNTTNSKQQDAIKRRLNLFKSVKTGARSTSRRGSAFSTKSQETVVNLTGINPADELQDECEVDNSDMDLDEDDGDESDDHGQNGYYFNKNEDEAACQDCYATHDAMLPADLELESQQQSLRFRHLCRLRRQSLSPDKNNVTFRKKAGICPPSLLECIERLSPIRLPEILHLIFQFVVDATPPDNNSQREIYSCMLVCKQWYLIAQKTLWREIRFNGSIKLDLFMDLLKRTETIECSGIESDKDIIIYVAPQHQRQRRQRHTSSTICEQPNTPEECSIMSPLAMQMRIRERTHAVKKIVLHKLKEIEDNNIMLLTSWFHNLQILEFYICEKLTDKIIHAVAENCPHLQQLLMPGCARITDSGISQIALHCPRMKHLDLRACSSVSDDSLMLVAKHCPELWHLNVGRVSSASRITGRSIVEIAKNTNLNTLGLAGCAMTDEAVIDIARHSNSGLHRCAMLTSASIRALMQLCPNMAVLEIKQCLLVTDMATLYRFSTRRVLVELCPELQRRLLEYKVELAVMNAPIQSSAIASHADGG